MKSLNYTIEKEVIVKKESGKENE